MTDTSETRAILVTGATSGLGLALVNQLKANGYSPILTGRNPEKVTQLASKADVPGYALDVADVSAIQQVTAQVEKEQGPLWGLINNAGIWLEGDFASYQPADIQAVLDTNTRGTMMMTHAVLPGMLERKRGAILNVVSTGALYCRKSISVYSASKWAIRGFTGCLEAECAPQGVRVMGFYPGKIDTPMYETAGIDKSLEIAMSSSQAATMALGMLADESMVWSQVSGRSIQDYS